jgi:hypothetical protein
MIAARIPQTASSRVYKKSKTGRSNFDSGSTAAWYLTNFARSIGPYINSSLSVNKDQIAPGAQDAKEVGYLRSANRDFVSTIANGASSLGKLLFDPATAEKAYGFGESFALAAAPVVAFGLGVGAYLGTQKIASMIQGVPEYEQVATVIGGGYDAWSGYNKGDPTRAAIGLVNISNALDEFTELDDDEVSLKPGYEMNSKGKPVSKAELAMGGTPYGGFDVKNKHSHLSGRVAGSPQDSQYGPYYYGDFSPATVS